MWREKVCRIILQECCLYEKIHRLQSTLSCVSNYHRLKGQDHEIFDPLFLLYREQISAVLGTFSFLR